MKRVALVYWSGTGNTESMAKAVAEGAERAGCAVVATVVSDADARMISDADAVALGCPAMGAEVLEESEMEPFVSLIESGSISGKQLVLFGSYDWGDGQWMREWEERMERAGASLKAPGLIAQNDPKDADLEACRALGALLAD